MAESGRENNYIYRRPPCPLYDARTLEGWLEELAGEGLLLVRNGARRGRVAFKQIAPHTATYRLTARPRNVSAPPDGEGGQYAWYEAGMLGRLYVYRSMEAGERSIQDDLLVQDAALAQIRKRLTLDILAVLLCFVAYPLLLLLRGTLLLNVVGTGTWLCLLGAVTVLWLFGDSLAEYLRALGVRKKLSAGERPAPGPRPDGRRYHAKNAAQILLVAVFLALALGRAGLSLAGVGVVPLQAYTGEPPFATYAQVSGGSGGQSDGEAREWSDLLCPRNLTWRESGSAALPDGGTREGALYVDYHEAAGPVLARWLAEEYVQQSRRLSGAQELELPALDVDFAFGWRSGANFSTVVLRRGSVTVRATLWQTSGEALETADWVTALAESLR